MGAPFNVLVDKKGVGQYTHSGYNKGDEKHYEEIIQKLLAQ